MTDSDEHTRSRTHPTEILCEKAYEAAFDSRSLSLEADSAPPISGATQLGLTVDMRRLADLLDTPDDDSSTRDE